MSEDNDDQEIQVEVEVPVGQDVADGASDQDELAQYGHKVKNRINKMTEKWRRAERDGEEAKRLAQQLYQENQQLKDRIKGLDTGYMSEYGTRLEAQSAAVKDYFKKAYESGDAEALAAAQEQMSRIAIDQERFRLAKQRSDQSAMYPTQADQAYYATQAQTSQKADPKAQTWAEKNEWFGTDKMLTAAALAIHSTLVEDEGFDPNSEEYYSEVDRRIRREFPSRFKTAQSATPARVASVASSASRAAVQGRRSVKLSASEVAMAKRLGVPLEEYAKYVKD